MVASKTRHSFLGGTVLLVAVSALGLVLCVGFSAKLGTPEGWMWLLAVGLGVAWLMHSLVQRLLAPLAELCLLASRARESGAALALEPQRHGLFAELAELMQRLARPRATVAPQARKERGGGEEQSAFLRAVSHELRTPLNAILGFADVLLNELDGPITGEQREHLSIVRASGQRLSLLVTDMIDVAALSSGEGMRARTSIDVGEVLEVVREAAIERRGMRPVHVRVDVAAGAERVVTERDTLVRALRIVTEHLLEVTQSGEVALLWERVGDECVLRVEADGMADAAEELQALTDAGDVGETKPGAAPLRLAIARELLVLLGARVEQRRDEQGGAAILLRFPAGDVR
jgi:signal transduction histidine kinase